MPDLWVDGKTTLAFWEWGASYTIVKNRHIGLDQAPVPKGQPWDIPSLTSGIVARSVQSPEIGHITIVDTGRRKRRFISYCHGYYGGAVAYGTRLGRGDWMMRLALEGEKPGSLWGGVHCHVVVHDIIGGAYLTGLNDTYYDPAVEIAAYRAAAATAGSGSTPFDPEADMPLNANTDYDAFKNMMWRFLKFDSRDGGPVADGTQGPTVFERLNAIAASPAPVAETGIIANTEENYQTLASMIQRGFRFDVRPNGVGADWKLGASVFELLAANATVDYSKLAAAIVAAGGTTPTAAQIAKAVNDDAAKRLGS